MIIPFAELVPGDVFDLDNRYTGGTTFRMLKIDDNGLVFQVKESRTNRIRKPGAWCKFVRNIRDD